MRWLEPWATRHTDGLAGPRESSIAIGEIVRWSYPNSAGNAGLEELILE